MPFVGTNWYLAQVSSAQGFLIKEQSTTVRLMLCVAGPAGVSP